MTSRDRRNDKILLEEFRKTVPASELQAWQEFLDYLRRGDVAQRLSNQHKSRRELQNRIRGRRNGNRPEDTRPTC